MFVLSEEHDLLRDAARGFVADRTPVSHLRAVRDRGEAAGFDRGVWGEMAAMGWTGVLIPEEAGGAGLGYVGLGLILEEMGRTLAPAPLLSTAMIGASALMLGEDAASRAAWLPKIAAGEAITAFAVDEGAHHAPAKTASQAAGGKLTGRKTFIADGIAADAFIVLARDAGGLGLYLVEAKAPGVAISNRATVDSRGAADIAFTDAPAVRLGGEALAEAVLDRARIGIAAEMLGTMTQAFETTSDYLKTRTQFGQLIGAFQALQHRAAKMLVEIELTRSCVAGALAALDAEEPPKAIAEWASLAKARAADTLHLVSNEMVQMHGGIGMTDAADPGLYLKRARVAAALYGSASFHRDRYAALAGF